MYVVSVLTWKFAEFRLSAYKLSMINTVIDTISKEGRLLRGTWRKRKWVGITLVEKLTRACDSKRRLDDNTNEPIFKSPSNFLMNYREIKHDRFTKYLLTNLAFRITVEAFPVSALYTRECAHDGVGSFRVCLYTPVSKLLDGWRSFSCLQSHLAQIRGHGFPQKAWLVRPVCLHEFEIYEPAPLAFRAFVTNPSSAGPGQQGEQDPPQPATRRCGERCLQRLC